jgi:hypothetical protein
MDPPAGTILVFRLAMGHRALIVFFIALSFAVNVSLAAEPSRKERYSLTISGGVSLGAYEAGQSWALVEVLRRFRELPTETGEGREGVLAGVTGASAGSINSLIAVVAWCERDAGRVSTVEDNLFWRTWIPLGIERLFPGEASCLAYQKEFPDLAMRSSPATPSTRRSRH